MQKAVNKVPTKQKLAQIKKTFEPKLASPLLLFTMYGVEYAKAQLSSQLLAVVMLSAFARDFKGKISPVTTHAQGPQLIKRVSRCGETGFCSTYLQEKKKM